MYKRTADGAATAYTYDTAGRRLAKAVETKSSTTTADWASVGCPYLSGKFPE
ncbi:hypothetical protein ACIO13_21870 [Streptomyces sp. NPDC087425]|uniref:hypothetical protein n=1 Tax=Streptomyces sp. NPDC087425 TaxID=3365787 RepID=UPI00380B11BC